jgi:hypothetical protein
MVNNIMQFIARNDFSAAEENINKAMQIKGSSQCRLDKSRVRSLKRQIEKPIEYIEAKNLVMEALSEGDTMKFIFGYATLEQFFMDNHLFEMSVNHQPLREILYQWADDKLVVKATEHLVKYKKYEVAIEVVGALKDFDYKAKHTKDIQQKIGMMMALDNIKKSEKIEQNYRITDRYQNDKWFKYFVKSYEKNLIKWQKENKYSLE